MQKIGRVVKGKRKEHEGAAGVKKRWSWSVVDIYLRSKRWIRPSLRRDSLLKMSFRNRGRWKERRVFEM